ncbi:BrnA antitoxin family protein [Methylobacterium sp. 2A]|jgi:uncharacterized protein (DUF4415 family)|nr:BrnA antitoxin family protein [Methylobacterium sp. 2A]
MRDKPTRHVLEPERRPGVTDFGRLAALSDADIADAAGQDPDAVPLDIDWSRAEVTVPPRKIPVSIRLDADVLDYFRHEGAGYQSRINAVLRSYVRARMDRES